MFMNELMSLPQIDGRSADDGRIRQRLFHQCSGLRRQSAIRMQKYEHVRRACGGAGVQLSGTAR
jgi:hypothetical protein